MNGARWLGRTGMLVGSFRTMSCPTPSLASLALAAHQVASPQRIRGALDRHVPALLRACAQGARVLDAARQLELHALGPALGFRESAPSPFCPVSHADSDHEGRTYGATQQQDSGHDARGKLIEQRLSEPRLASGSLYYPCLTAFTGHQQSHHQGGRGVFGPQLFVVMCSGAA